MAELTEDMIEAATDVVERVADQATQIAGVSRALSARETRLLLGGGVAGLVGGCALGFFVAKRYLVTKYTKIAEEEIAVVRDHYQAKALAEKPELDTVMETLGYKSKTTTTEQVEVEVVEATVEMENRNVFDEQDTTDDWDYATEVKSRKADTPYVIHVDEYRQNLVENDHEQITLTYYEDDDVLADVSDTVIEDQDAVIGVQNLNLFGHGSGDPNVVYVRNDRLAVDYEIVRSHGSYAEEVHGFIKHSNTPPRRSRRDWDG